MVGNGAVSTLSEKPAVSTEDPIEMMDLAVIDEAAPDADTGTGTTAATAAGNTSPMPAAGEEGAISLQHVLQLEAILAKEAQFPWKPIAFTFFQLFVLIVLGLIKGGKTGESFAGVSCGSPAYGSIIAVQW